MLERLLQIEESKQEQEAQQQFIDDAVHDNAYRYTAAAQKMFAAFRRENESSPDIDWQGFDAAQDFLAHANEELRRLVISRCALLALSATLPKNEKKQGVLSMLSHACWQLLHFSRADVNVDLPTRVEKTEKVCV